MLMSRQSQTSVCRRLWNRACQLRVSYLHHYLFSKLADSPGHMMSDFGSSDSGNPVTDKALSSQEFNARI